jgi:hypothetical protein
METMRGQLGMWPGFVNCAILDKEYGLFPYLQNGVMLVQSSQSIRFASEN